MPICWPQIQHYAKKSNQPVEPPEYLSEAERKLFEKLKESFQPLKLEVSIDAVLDVVTTPTDDPLVGARHLWRLRLDVCARHSLQTIRRIARD
jgi:hypothetical protein